jgi:excisionase family DNA binding protein
MPPRPTPPSDAEEFLTVPEVASILRVSSDTLYRAIRLDQVPGAFRVGKSIRIRQNAVLSWGYGEKGRDWRSKGKQR